MKPDTLVFDIETQNFFTDPDVGWGNFGALKISAVGIYSYNKNEYVCFDEHELDLAAELFRGSDKIIGFASNRYDVPVLNLYFQKMKYRDDVNLWTKNRIDLLEEIEKAYGGRVSLSRLAEANLGIKKDMHGGEAIGLYERGEIEKLKEYCLGDVRLTKELYDLYVRDKVLLVPDKKSGGMMRVDFSSASPSAVSLV
ncbi:MAG: ribonuclease H-like domain-containing protein [Patescibacteria group bacterium]